MTFLLRQSQYRHWKLSFAGPVATLATDFDEDAGLRSGYKLNSYDLGVDIELNDAAQGDMRPIRASN
jgi:benzoyl-CoA-dihydrodiol lyase